MSIYKARWRNALKHAARINRFLKKGYLVFDQDGDVFKTPFSIKEKQIVVTTHSPGHVFHALYFENDPHFDHGLHTPIKEYNKQFQRWSAVAPQNIVKLSH